MASSLNSLSEDLLRQAVGVDIRGVEDIDAGVNTKANKSFPPFDAGRAPRPKKLSFSAERAEAKT